METKESEVINGGDEEARMNSGSTGFWLYQLLEYSSEKLNRLNKPAVAHNVFRFMISQFARFLTVERRRMQ